MPHSCEAQRERSEKREVNTAMNRVPRLRRYSDSGVHGVPCAESPNRERHDGSEREQEAGGKRRSTTPSEGDGTVCGVTGSSGRCEGISMFSMNTSSGSLPVPWSHRSHASHAHWSLGFASLISRSHRRRLQAHAHSRGEASGRFSCPRPEASFVSLFTHSRDSGARRAERTRRLPGRRMLNVRRAEVQYRESNPATPSRMSPH